MGPVLRLPTAGGVERFTLSARSPVHDLPAARPGPPASRQVYAAAHVVVDPLADAVDWDATLAFRRHLWSLGLGVADAMDTAQRGAALTWPLARELITRTGAEARAGGGALVCGAATDQLPPGARPALGDLAGAYVEQAGWIRQAGGTPVLMASRHLAAAARDADDYARVYDEALSQLDGPVLLHWLGEPFDPAMRGYWGSTDLDVAMDTMLEVIARHADRVAGIKISLLDAGREVAMRRRLPAGVRMFTGDDFHYDELIAGDEHGHSDALLGVLDPIAAPARAALARLDAGDPDGYAALLAPTVPLARHLFATPTSAYKTGVVFLAWLDGHQDHFHLLGGAQSLRPVPHLVELFRRADAAGALADPDLAARRMRAFLAVAGFEA
jgi:hypothetical protein